MENHIFIAKGNASSDQKKRADIICNGTQDDKSINEAIQALGQPGGKTLARVKNKRRKNNEIEGRVSGNGGIIGVDRMHEKGQKPGNGNRSTGGRGGNQ